MTRTVIDLDDDLVAEVARELGTRTKKDTVNTALREVLENRRRAMALTRLREATADGAFDLTLLADKAELPPVTAAQFLIDTSALARLLRPGAESFGWDQAAAAGLIARVPDHRAGVLLQRAFTGRSRAGHPGRAVRCSAGCRSTTAPSPAPGTFKAS